MEEEEKREEERERGKARLGRIKVLNKLNAIRNQDRTIIEAWNRIASQDGKFG